MSYYFARKIDGPFDQIVERVMAALKERGFGVLTTIDVSATLKEKIGADIRPYLILGACNPRYAYEALKTEDKIGTMLPCNVIVQATEDGKVEVAAVDPEASMQAVDNPKLIGTASEVRRLLQEVVEGL